MAARNFIRKKARHVDDRLSEEVVAGFQLQHVRKPLVFAFRISLITAMSYRHFVRGCVADLGPCANLQRFTGQTGRSRRIRVVIVTLLFVPARSEAVYDMRFVPLRAVCLHQGSQSGHRNRPIGRSVSGT